MKVTIGKKNEEQTACETKSVENTVVNETNIPEFAEVVEKRGRCQKVFTDGKGKSMTKFYGKPVHRKTVNGFEPIDNTLSESDEDYHTTFGNYNARFFKNRIKGKIFDVEKDQCSVALVSRDVAEHDCITENCGSEDEDVCSDGKIVLHGIRENTDIEYLTKSDRIKENIIIKERSDKYDYEFDLALENLTVKASADGNSLEIINKGNGTLWGYIPAPFMYDANGKRSDDVYYEIDAEGKEISLKVIADERWINSEERAFPVVIDPQIVITNFYGYGYETEEYDDGIFEFNTYSLYGGKKLVGHELRINTTEGYLSPETMPGYIKSEIVIDIEKIKKSINTQIRSARLILRLDELNSTATEARINGSLHYIHANEDIIVSITNSLQYSWDKNENVVIEICPYAYRDNFVTEYAVFYPPILELEFEDYITKLEIVADPVKGYAYLPGDKFDPEGLILHAKYYSGEIIPIIYPDFTYTPSGSLATYDKKITFYYDEAEVSHELQIYQGGFNDRRPKEGCENLYALQYVDKDTGNPKDNNIYYVRLTLADGAKNENIGTPLNAENLNRNIIVDAEHIYGIIKQENLPDYLKKTMINDNETDNTDVPTETVTEEIETAEADDTEETVNSTGTEENSNE